jgi:uncharacterized protein (DUF433 family)
MLLEVFEGKVEGIASPSAFYEEQDVTSWSELFTFASLEGTLYDKSNRTVHTGFVKKLMEASEALEYQISVSSEVMHGSPCIAGTRIPVHLLLEKLAAGYTVERLCHSYSRLTEEQIRVAIQYAAKVLDTGDWEYYKEVLWFEDTVSTSPYRSA